jgi:hypothetical protein
MRGSEEVGLQDEMQASGFSNHDVISGVTYSIVSICRTASFVLVLFLFRSP